MRTLTLKREKNATASFEKFFVYIEDTHLATTEIDGAKVRPIGYIRNGESVTYTVADHEARFFVVYGKKGYSYVAESVTIPEGDTPLYLIGNAVQDPVHGKRFSFHGVTESKTINNRNKGYEFRRKIKLTVLFVLLALFAASTAVSSFLSLPRPCEFHELHVFIPNLYRSVGDGVYKQNYSTITLEAMEKSIADGDTLREFAYCIQRERTKLSYDRYVKTENGLTYLKYDVSSSSSRYIFFYESESRYYIMTFQKPISESQVFSIALSAFIKNDPAWKPAPTVSTDFAFHELTLTLDNRYTETNDTSSSLLKSPKYTVQINRFAISEQSEEIKTTEDFAWELLIDRPKDFDAETRSVVTENGLFYFILSSPDQPSIYYAVFVYESDTHYYTVAIGAPKMRFNDNFDYITEIAKSVRFE